MTSAQAGRPQAGRRVSAPPATRFGRHRAAAVLIGVPGNGTSHDFRPIN
jgi:hypothetical protein